MWDKENENKKKKKELIIEIIISSFFLKRWTLDSLSAIGIKINFKNMN